MKRSVVLAVVLSGLAVACTIMNGLELPQASTDPNQPGADGGKHDGSSGTSSSTSSSGQPGLDGSVCIPHHAPPQPAPTGGADQPMIVAALESFLSETTGGPIIGLDLDNKCTCPAPEACTGSGQQHCDPNGDGTDNSSADVFRTLTAASLNPLESASLRVAGGTYGLLFEVSNYNGQANDDSVSVQIIKSRGISNPQFQTVQTWPTSGTTFASTAAWVNESTLVAQFDHVEVPFLDDVRTPPLLHAVTITGPITGGTLASVLMVGRANTTDMINGVGELLLDDQNPQYGPVCEQGLFQGVGSSVCAFSDLSLSPSDDGAGTAHCNALSMAVEMTLVPATAGSNQGLATVEERCGDANPIQCN